MIKTKNLEIKIGNLNYNYYKNLGYTFNKVGDVIIIDIKHLTNGSKTIVDICCDYCGIDLKVPFKRYNLSTKNINKYSCTNKECSNQKIIEVCQYKYGVDNPFQSEDVKRKSKETLLLKYGAEHPMYIEEIKDKIKKTNIDKYGVSYYVKTEECKDKIKIANIDKYGVSHHSKTELGKEMRKETRIKRGLQIPDDKLSEFYKYRRKVDNLTNIVKKNILENWDGYDYYDNEYIKENFNFNKNDRLYPHFDHKISVIYGFKNNIDPSEISNIDNICITKQWINGLKGSQCENVFKTIFNKNSVSI
jgi:hypothetical protein